MNGRLLIICTVRCRSVKTDYVIWCTLTTLLKVLKDATEFFSQATPNLATVIPAMDHIDQVLATDAAMSTMNLAVRAALCVGKSTLNHYYECTDLSKVYQIAMGKSFTVYHKV